MPRCHSLLCQKWWNSSFLFGFTKCITNNCCQCDNVWIGTFPGTFEVNSRPSGLHNVANVQHSAPEQASSKKWLHLAAFFVVSCTRTVVFWSFANWNTGNVPLLVFCVCVRSLSINCCIQSKSTTGKNANLKTSSSLEGMRLFLNVYSATSRPTTETSEVVETAIPLVCSLRNNPGPLRVRAIPGTCA